MCPKKNETCTDIPLNRHSVLNPDTDCLNNVPKCNNVLFVYIHIMLHVLRGCNCYIPITPAVTQICITLHCDLFLEKHAKELVGDIYHIVARDILERYFITFVPFV